MNDANPIFLLDLDFDLQWKVNSDDAADAKTELEALLSGANNDDFSKELLCQLINVDRYIQNLKLDKALGPDGVCQA